MYQTVFKNSCSRKKIDSLQEQRLAAEYKLVFKFLHDIMLMMLFIWKGFTNPLNTLKYRTNIF